MSFITKPFSWLLLQLYAPFESYALAIIMFALVVKIILLPFQLKSKRSMMRMSSLTPIIKELEKKHGGNKQKYQQEVSNLYKEENINPMSGCLWTLIPFPILIALYSVVRAPLTNVMALSEAQIATISSTLTSHGVVLDGGTYSELEIAKYISEYYNEISAAVPEVLNLNYTFLGINLCDIPQWNFFMSSEITTAAITLFCIPFVSSLLSWFTMKVTQSSQAQTQSAEQAAMMKNMNFMMPLMSLYICFIMPAAMGIYWIANSLFAILQELSLSKHFKKMLDAEAAERAERMNAKANEIERRREETEKKRLEGKTEQNKNTNKRKLEAQEKAREADRRASERAKEEALFGKKAEGPASQVGRRRNARGRAYDPDRYEGFESEVETNSSGDEE